jgi:hypothetical protein
VSNIGTVHPTPIYITTSTTKHLPLLSKHTPQHTDKAWAKFIQLLNLRLLWLTSFPSQFLRCLSALLSFRFYRIRDIFVVKIFIELRVRTVVIEFKVLQIKLYCY